MRGRTNHRARGGPSIGSVDDRPPQRSIHLVGLIEGLHDIVGENLSLLTPVDQAWQPSDFLPDLTGEDWAERLARFREPAKQLSDEVLVVLVGSMITEEALPNYSVRLESVARDATGTDATPWALWLRGWTSEENRHGDVLNAYLRLTGRVDMRAVERTIHHLIPRGVRSQERGRRRGGPGLCGVPGAGHADHPRQCRQTRPGAGRGGPRPHLPEDRRGRVTPRDLLHPGRARGRRPRSRGGGPRVPQDAPGA